MKKLILFAFLSICWTSAVVAQQPTFHDALLDHLEGGWVIRGTIASQDTVHDLKAQWVLNHQYLRLEEISREKDAQGRPAYAANVYIGWDGSAHDDVCVFLDTFGDISTQSLTRP